jgi:5-methylcytosine-specific restriction endonuclease McrA
MCKPHYRRDYYARNKARENASNKAYREARPEYWKSRWADYAERRWGVEREARQAALSARLAASHKECTKCFELKAKDEFHPDPRRRSGLYSWCNETRDPAVEAVRQARYRATPEGRAKALARQRKWNADNPERAREQVRRYQARKLVQSVGVVDYAAILERHGMLCHLCETEIPSLDTLHFDHVIPLSKGGPHSEDNIRPSHATCNLRKGAKLAA